MTQQLFFICHSTKDKRSVNQLVTLLEAEGARCWVAPRDVRPGRDYAAEITAAIKLSTALVLVYSKSSAQAVDCLAEIELAFRSRTPIFPVRLDATPIHEDYEYRLARTQWITGSMPRVAHALMETTRDETAAPAAIAAKDAPSLLQRWRVPALCVLGVLMAAAIAVAARPLFDGTPEKGRSAITATPTPKQPASSSSSVPSAGVKCLDGTSSAAGKTCDVPNLRYVFPSFAEAADLGDCVPRPRDAQRKGKLNSWRCSMPSNKRTWLNYSIWETTALAATYYRDKYESAGAPAKDHISFAAKDFANDGYQASRIFRDASLPFSVTAVADSSSGANAVMRTLKARKRSP